MKNLIEFLPDETNFIKAQFKVSLNLHKRLQSLKIPLYKVLINKKKVFRKQFPFINFVIGLNFIRDTSFVKTLNENLFQKIIPRGL